MVVSLRRRREREAERDRRLRVQEKELQDARRMQRALMPKSPAVEGLDVAGACQTANHVGGDLYRYFVQDGGFVAALTDVTGHAMEGAIPAVMFSGLLEREMEVAGSLERRLERLNQSLCQTLAPRTFICASLVQVDGESLRVASCGNPYPLLVRNGETRELEAGGYPLGVRRDMTYGALEQPLRAGDVVVLYSDGIPERTNAEGDLFGYERTFAALREACAGGAAAADIVDHLMSASRQFAGSAPQEDDMTCVVIRVGPFG
jgi:sigma-B regulation protein RsbU (phosphoserine phosphatase)